MHEPPRSPRESILNRVAAKWMVSICATSGLIAMGLYWILLNSTGDLYLTRTMIMTFLCMESLMLVFSVRSFYKPLLRRDIFSNRILTWAVGISFAFLIAVIYVPWFQDTLSTAPLSLSDWGIVLCVNIAEILIIDLFKQYYYKRRRIMK